MMNRLIKHAFRYSTLEIIPKNSLKLVGSCNMSTSMPSQDSSIVFSKIYNGAFHQSRAGSHAPYTFKTVEDRIMLVLNLYDKIDNTRLTLDSDFVKDLGLDSLDYVDMILAIEDEFQLEIPDGDADRLKTPRDIFQYICDRKDVYE